MIFVSGRDYPVLKLLHSEAVFEGQSLDFMNVLEVRKSSFYEKQLMKQEAKNAFLVKLDIGNTSVTLQSLNTL